MSLASIDLLPMGLNKVCTCRSDHWTRNISALCHTCGGHIHPCSEHELLRRTEYQLTRMYQIEPVAFDSSVPIQRGLKVLYGAKKRSSLQTSVSDYRITHDTHGDNRPYRYDKKAPIKLGVIFTGQARRYDSDTKLEQSVNICKLLMALNQPVNANDVHNKLFAYAPTIDRPESRIVTAPATFVTQAYAWCRDDVRRTLDEWQRGSIKFVFDRRDFTPTLLPKFLAFWNRVLRRNDMELVCPGDHIGRRATDSLTTTVDYAERMAAIPYVNPSVGITHRSRIPHELQRSTAFHYLLNRNHITLELFDVRKMLFFPEFLKALECSFYYLRDVSLRRAAHCDLMSMAMWCMEQPDRREHYDPLLQYVSNHED